ncbi:hypothetical protein GMOD_00006589 [Pyrenophora seminiperda CCB06]|uniref:Uncharacterized protein n=1 Tax=Pyrenophora seminiperda CCB06 TaxID=1302712 RepID=A0A3M7MAT1_9PLEO|nr:hypothetical protein GMOD_00006589 [Pyrenophora seminiperda CCB06]
MSFLSSLVNLVFTSTALVGILYEVEMHNNHQAQAERTSTGDVVQPMDIMSTFLDIPTFDSDERSTSEETTITVTDTETLTTTNATITTTISKTSEEAAPSDSAILPLTSIITVVSTFYSDAGSATSSANTFASPTFTAPVASSPSSSSSASSNSNWTSLSQSTKIGVAVGAVLGGLAIGFSAFCLGRHLRRTGRSAIGSDLNVHYRRKLEKDGKEMFRGELDGAPMTQQTVAELETSVSGLNTSILYSGESGIKEKKQWMVCAQAEQAQSRISTPNVGPHENGNVSSRIREADVQHENSYRTHLDGIQSDFPQTGAYEDSRLTQNPWA